MQIKLICRKAHEMIRVESDIKELESEEYTIHSIIPIYSDPNFADFCIFLKK